MAAPEPVDCEGSAADAEARIRKAMIDDANEMVSRLTLALLLSQDAELQTELRRGAGLGETDTVQVRLPETDIWLKLGQEGSPAILRAPDPAAPQIDFQAAVDGNETVRGAMVTGARRTRAYDQAFNLLSPLFNAGAAPTRRQMFDGLAWAPIVERVAYRFFSRSTSLLDLLRPGLLAAAERSPALDAAREGYWALAHTGSHVSLLAGAAQSAPWLLGVADQVAWAAWTPTFPLVRERTLWLALVAARSAVAFGAPVVEKYLEVLALATHPLKRFDALFGLVAIGLSRGDGRSVLIGALERRRAVAMGQDVLQPDLTRAMFDSALRTLRDPAAAAEEYGALFGDPAAQATGLMTMSVLRRDPTQVLPSASVLGFIALAAVASLPIEALYPVDVLTDPVRSAGGADIGEILVRAWGDGEATARRRIH